MYDSSIRTWVVAWLLAALALASAPAPTTAEPVPYVPRDGACRAATVAGGGVVLDARFWRGSADTTTVSSGEGAVIAGNLTTAGGVPVAGATLCVREWFLGAGAAATDRIAVPRLGLARTDASGAFFYRMPAGPNREAIVTYGGVSGAAYALRYFAKARPILKSAPRRVRNRGRAARFRGRLLGPHARGRVIVLQAADGPERWVTFRQTTTDGAGRFRASYRFRNTFRPRGYAFRALVPRQAGYPWLPGASRSVSVRVG